jgi:LmbE family N-acetylglucosaminyl deacetylase
MRTPVLLLACLLSSGGRLSVPQTVQPDERFKTDVLLVVAHPDDETAVGSFLAKTVYDDRKSVAILYCTHGTGGGNSRGGEQAAAMGAVREFESRSAVAAFGIQKVWFLSGRDTPGQDVFRSLQEWGHGEVLEEVVRFVRLTRPEVIVTWLPAVVAGENHGDHQAAGVIATEAFDLAGDPTVFPAQVTPARERGDIGNSTEGLLPWQPKKLYFFSDASREIFAEGPRFDLHNVSPSQGVPYIQLAAKLSVPHETQGEVSHEARRAIEKNDFAPLAHGLERFKLIFGKSLVPCSPGGGVFDGISEGSIPYLSAPGFTPRPSTGVHVELGGPFAFYRDFCSAHGIDGMARLVKPELEVAAGSFLFVPILLRNGTEKPVLFDLRAQLPAGWREAGGTGSYTVGPGGICPVQAFVQTPGSPTSSPAALRWEARTGGAEAPWTELKVNLVEWALPQ